MTLEKLFHLSPPQLDVIFGQNMKHKIKSLKQSYLSSSMESKPLIYTQSREMEVNEILSQDSRIWLTNSKMSVSNQSTKSKKPLHCPHDPCHKLIASSLFYTHFIHDHKEIPKFKLFRKKEFQMIVDPLTIEYGRTMCLGMITLYNNNKTVNFNLTHDHKGIKNVLSRFNKDIPIGTCWVMVSGSQIEVRQFAYVLYWVMTDLDESNRCTIELSSNKDLVSYSTYCGMNHFQIRREISEVMEGLNCLYLHQSAVEHMLKYGPKLNLRITIH